MEGREGRTEGLREGGRDGWTAEKQMDSRETDDR